MAAMLVTSMFAGLIAISLPNPAGIFALIGALEPLGFGFQRVFKVADGPATWITVFPTYGVAVGFMWAYARLIKSMASSKLLPPVLGTTNRFGTPWVAHLVGSVLGYAVCLAVNYVPIVVYYLLPVTMAFSFLSYIGQCLAYIYLRLDFPVMKQSTMKSPFGISGAVYSLCVWVVCLVGTLLNGRVIIVIAPFSVVATVYYYAIARKRQTFSDEENKILLTAHVSRFNAQKRKTKSRTKPADPVQKRTREGNSGMSARHSADGMSLRGSAPPTGNFSVIPEHQLPDMALIHAAHARHAAEIAGASVMSARTADQTSTAGPS